MRASCEKGMLQPEQQSAIESIRYILQYRAHSTNGAAPTIFQAVLLCSDHEYKIQMMYGVWVRVPYIYSQIQGRIRKGRNRNLKHHTPQFKTLTIRPSKVLPALDCRYPRAVHAPQTVPPRVRIVAYRPVWGRIELLTRG